MQHGEKADIPVMVRDSLCYREICTLSTMRYPKYSKKVQDMQREFCKCREVVFMDAARYTHRHSMWPRWSTTKANARRVLVKTLHAERAEEVAITLAMAITEAEAGISNSQAAIQNYANGQVSQEALRLLTVDEDRKKNDTFAIWTSARVHCPLASNKAADTMARELANRVDAAPAEATGEEVGRMYH